AKEYRSISLKKFWCQKQSTDCLSQILAVQNSMYATVGKTLHSRTQIETTRRRLYLGKDTGPPQTAGFCSFRGFFPTFADPC
ncbi:mCG1042076, partial [Mus musculus]